MFLVTSCLHCVMIQSAFHDHVDIWIKWIWFFVESHGATEGCGCFLSMLMESEITPTLDVASDTP